MNIIYDHIIIGGGFFGCMVAQQATGRVLLLEKEDALIMKASAKNQARVHNGYHYPRNYLTALSSHKNYPRFLKDFKSAVKSNYTMLYPILKTGKTSAKEFRHICKQINIPLHIAPEKYRTLFNPNIVEQVFIGEESAFDYIKLRDVLTKRLRHNGVDIQCNTEVIEIAKDRVYTANETYYGHKITVCVYADTNKLLEASHLPTLPIRNEMTVMPLVTVPDEFKNLGITIMDGDAGFSIYPFPAENAHTIHHVTLTPNYTTFTDMKRQICKVIPSMRGLKHRTNIKARKTIFLQNDQDDGRPIMYRRDYGYTNLDVIVGGKLDNIYDLLEFEENNKLLNIV